MKVLLSWLREFAPISGDSDDIAVQLTDLGMELEAVEQIGGGLGGVVVSRVLDIREHPDADKIRLVDVDAGDGEPLQICCGASNMNVGDLVPLATIGTVMPGGMAIAKRKMRGQISNGMLCSSRELEIGDDHAGILVLPEDLEVGTSIGEALKLTEDVAFDFDALPNRPDTLSIAGVARDLSAHQLVEFNIPAPDPTTGGPDVAQVASVKIDAAALCGRFCALVVSGVTVGPSPRWMAQRLIAAGMRPINNIVDISNYVMLEFGQPTHAYDLAKLPEGVIATRWARPGETIQTLDGEERTLSGSDGVIVDGADTPIGIAGVMGGASTEISTTTSDVLVEAAWWDPAIVAGTSTRLNLHSEASLRFKRGVDPISTQTAALRVAELLGQIAGGELHPGVIDERGSLPEPATVRVRTSKVNSLLGVALTRDEISALLSPIGFTTTTVGEDLDVSIPPWRPDSSIEVDVIEEVARHYGMANIVKTVPVSPHVGQLTRDQRDRRTLRRTLISRGVSEAMPMPFLAPGDLERSGLPGEGLVIANPLAAEESVLRTSLLPGLLKAVEYNARHRQFEVRLFELGRSFGVDDGVILDVDESTTANRVLGGEVEQLAVALVGDEAGSAVELLERLLRSIGRWPTEDGSDPAVAGLIPALSLDPGHIPGLHPGRSASAVIDGRTVGRLGEVDPRVLEAHHIERRVAWLELDLSVLLEIEPLTPTAHEVSRFPSSDVDLAFVVDERLAAADVRATVLRAARGSSVVDADPTAVDLFDVFRSAVLGPEKKSLAFRVRFQAGDRTLTDGEVATMRQAAIRGVEAEHDGHLRA